MKFLFLVLCLSANAATYYVDPATGNNANNGTSTSTPWAQLPGSVGFSGAGWVTINNGDTIYVKGGSINNCQVLFDSTKYSPSAALDSVQIRSGDVVSWGVGRAVFDEQNTRLYGLALGVSGIRVNRLEIKNVAAGANAIWGNGSAGIELGSTTTQPKFLHIDDCYIHDTPRSADDQGHGIEGYGPDEAFQAASCTIEHNTIGNGTAGNIGTKGIEFYGTNHTIRANFITGTKDHGIVVSGRRCDITGNIVYMLPLYVHQPVFAIKVNFNNNDVWNNVCYSYLITTNGTFNSLEGIGTLNNASYNRILFNTVINCYDLSGNQRCVAYSIGDEDAAGTNNIVALNIGAFCGSTAGTFNNVQAYAGNATTGTTFSYNDFFRTSSGSQSISVKISGTYNYYTAASAMSGSPINGNTFANLQSADPVLTGGALPNGLGSAFGPNTTYFQLTGNTPTAIKSTGQSGYVGTSTNGASSASTKFATDIAGQTRSFWSMGAYEFVSFPPVLTNVTMIMK